MRPLTVLVVQHEPRCPAAWLGDWLEQEGLELDTIEAWHEPLPTTLDRHDAIVVLGGSMGANDDDLHAWLAPTRGLLDSATRDGVPTLGVCLGHQLLTRAQGGEVARNVHGRATGLTAVGLQPASRGDALLGGIEPGALGVQWNDDVAVALPDDAEVLTVAPDGTPQAVRFGPRSWGVQWHPEANPAVFAGWIDADADAGRREAAALEAIAAAEGCLERTWRPLAGRFAAIAAEARESRSH